MESNLTLRLQKLVIGLENKRVKTLRALEDLLEIRATRAKLTVWCGADAVCGCHSIARHAHPKSLRSATQRVTQLENYSNEMLRPDNVPAAFISRIQDELLNTSTSREKAPEMIVNKA